jgi:hypothetical protein
MHFSKKTVRTLIAIACVSVSANQLQAGFWDWFRCGKHHAPTATESMATMATHSTSAAITLSTYAEEKEPFKESKEPKEPQQTQPVMLATYTGSIPAVATTSSAPAIATTTSPVSVTTTAASTTATHATVNTKQPTQPQKGRIQRFFDWLETKLNHHFSMQELSNSALMSKLFNAFGRTIADISDCKSYFAAQDIEEVNALCQYQAWQDYYAWEREHGTKEVVYLDTDTDGTPLKREIITQQIMTPRKGAILVRWATYCQNKDGSWQCLEHGSSGYQRYVKNNNPIKNAIMLVRQHPIIAVCTGLVLCSYMLFSTLPEQAGLSDLYQQRIQDFNNQRSINNCFNTAPRFKSFPRPLQDITLAYTTTPIDPNCVRSVSDICTTKTNSGITSMHCFTVLDNSNIRHSQSTLHPYKSLTIIGTVHLKTPTQQPSQQCIPYQPMTFRYLGKYPWQKESLDVKRNELERLLKELSEGIVRTRVSEKSNQPFYCNNLRTNATQQYTGHIAGSHSKFKDVYDQVDAPTKTIRYCGMTCCQNCPSGIILDLDQDVRANAPFVIPPNEIRAKTLNHFIQEELIFLNLVDLKQQLGILITRSGGVMAGVYHLSAGCKNSLHFCDTSKGWPQVPVNVKLPDNILSFSEGTIYEPAFQWIIAHELSHKKQDINGFRLNALYFDTLAQKPTDQASQISYHEEGMRRNIEINADIIGFLSEILRGRNAHQVETEIADWATRYQDEYFSSQEARGLAENHPDNLDRLRIIQELTKQVPWMIKHANKLRRQLDKS